MTNDALYFNTSTLNKLHILTCHDDSEPLSAAWKHREIQASLAALEVRGGEDVGAGTRMEEAMEEVSHGNAPEETSEVKMEVEAPPLDEVPVSTGRYQIVDEDPPTLSETIAALNTTDHITTSARNAIPAVLLKAHLSEQSTHPKHHQNYLATCHIKSNNPHNSFYLDLSKETLASLSPQLSVLSLRLFYNELSVHTLKRFLLAFIHADVIFWEVPNHQDLLAQLRILKIVRGLRHSCSADTLSSIGGNSARGAPTLTFLWKVSVTEMEQLRKTHGSRVLAHLENLRLEMESNLRSILKRSMIAAGTGVKNPLCSLDPKKCVLVQHAMGRGVEMASSGTSESFDPFMLWSMKKTTKIPKNDPPSSTSHKQSTSKSLSYDQLTRYLKKQYDFRASLGGYGKHNQSTVITDARAWISEVIETEQLLNAPDFMTRHKKKIMDCIDPNFSFSLQRSQQAYALVFDQFQKKTEMKKYRSKKNFIQSIVVMFASYACGECLDIFMSALVERLSQLYVTHMAALEEKQHEQFQNLPRGTHQTLSYSLVVSERTDRERLKGAAMNVPPDYGCPISRVTYTSHGSASHYDATKGIESLVDMNPDSKIHTTKLKWFEQSWPTHARSDGHPKKAKQRCYIGLLYHNVVTEEFFIITPKILHSVKFGSDDENQNPSADILLRSDVPIYIPWPKQLTKKKEKHLNQLTRLERLFVVTPKTLSGNYIFSPKFAVNFQDQHVVYDLEDNIALPTNSMLEIRFEHNEAYSSLSLASVQMLHAKLSRNYLVQSYE